jgi:hypothetical protein
VATEVTVEFTENGASSTSYFKVNITKRHGGRSAVVVIRTDVWLGYPGYPCSKVSAIAAAAMGAISLRPMTIHNNSINGPVISGHLARFHPRYRWSGRRGANYFSYAYRGEINTAPVGEPTRSCSCDACVAGIDIVSVLSTDAVSTVVVTGRRSGTESVTVDGSDVRRRRRPVALRNINVGVNEEAGNVHGDCDCGTCKYSRRDADQPLSVGSVHPYSYIPAAWRFLRCDGERQSSTVFLGIELETDRPYSARYGTNARPISNEVAVSMARPSELWFAKRDGSVEGPEFVSHPASLAYWRSKRDELSDMFKMLLHAGFRSHDGGKAGLHVNINRQAFTGSAHFSRFLNIIYYSTAWSLVMSQRVNSQVEHWCKLPIVTSASAYEQTLIEDATKPFHDVHEYDRYRALNSPEGRFEFRLPRGTLRVDRFFKNLEWTVGMIEYTRDRSLADSTPGEFMEWVAANKSDYPDLAAFIEEKKSLLGKVKNDRGF